MDVGMLSFVITAVTKEWHLTSAQAGLIGSVSSLGMAIGAVVFGILADRYSRQSVLIFSLLTFSIFNGLSALVSSYLLFLMLRFLIGCGLGGELPVASTLVSENAPEAVRGRTVVLLESFWAGGWLVAAVVSYLLIPRFGWRAALLLTSLTALYALFLRSSLKRHAPKSVRSVKKLPLPVRLAQLFSPEHRRATLMLWIVWFMVVFSYYGMFLWLPSVLVMRGYSIVQSFGYVMIMTLAQLPGYFMAAWCIEKWGRKATLVFFLVGAALAAIVFGWAQSLAILLIAGMLLSFFNLGAWGALYAYSPEQYPADIRGTGTGIAAGVGRIGGILGPVLVGYLLQAKVSIAVIFIIFFVAIIIAAGTVSVLGTETKQSTEKLQRD
nr:MFS transporter [Lactobacillus selangorensis]